MDVTKYRGFKCQFVKYSAISILNLIVGEWIFNVILGIELQSSVLPVISLFWMFNGTLGFVVWICALLINLERKLEQWNEYC